MLSAGQLLREERLKRKRNLGEIAAETCICTRYLEAIEADNLEVLPGDFFYRSFLKQYARALGLDQVTTDAIVAAAVPFPATDPIPALASAYLRPQIEEQNKNLYKPRTGVAIALLAVVLVGCSGLYAIWNKMQVEKETPAAVAVAAADVPPSPQPQVSEPQPTPPPAELGKIAEPGKIQVDLAATETTWVSLSSAGKTVFSGVLDPAQTKNFAVSDQARLLTGNAAGLDVRWNGKSIGPIGSRGQVRIVLLRADHYEILPPRGM